MLSKLFKLRLTLPANLTRSKVFYFCGISKLDHTSLTTKISYESEIVVVETSELNDLLHMRNSSE